LAEIHTRVVPLQQLSIQLGNRCNGLQTVLTSKSVCDEQTIILRNLSVPTGTVNSNINLRRIRKIGSRINVDSLHPLLCSQTAVSHLSNRRIVISLANLVEKSVTKKLIIDAITREGNIHSCMGLENIYVCVGTLVYIGEELGVC